MDRLYSIEGYQWEPRRPTFTSSTSFANPAVTAARALSDTLAGIGPASVPGFVLAQLAGTILAVAAVGALYPLTAARSPEGPPVETKEPHV